MEMRLFLLFKYLVELGLCFTHHYNEYCWNVVVKIGKQEFYFEVYKEEDRLTYVINIDDEHTFIEFNCISEMTAFIHELNKI